MTTPPSNISATKTPTVGSMRFEADKRQIGGVLMLLGMCALIQPLFPTAAGIGSDGNTMTQGAGFAALIGGLCVITTGLISLYIGYMQCVHDWGDQRITALAIVWTQTAWLSYLSNMVAVGQGINMMAFLPEGTIADNRFLGACGIMAILAYGFGLVGSVAFFQFSLFTYQSGKPEDRPASYYKGRLAVYSFMLAFGGLSQLMLASFSIANFASPPEMPVVVAFYIISVPALSIVVGVMQIIGGLFGMKRSLLTASGKQTAHNSFYQIFLGLSWIIQVVFQAIAQSAYPPGETAAGLAPTVTAFSLGLTLMPAYLDYKMRTTPETISPHYYGFLSHESGSSRMDANGKDLKAKDDLESASETAPEIPEYSA